MGIGIFNKLRALNIYDDSGARLRPLSELNEDRMTTLLADASKDRVVCPICQAPLRSDSDNTLLVHLQDYHSNPNDEQIRSPPGGNEFIFKGSNGWVRNFVDRHNMHNVLTVGEMGSNNQEAAKDYVDSFRDELIQRGISPRNIVNVLLNIDETGIVYKSVPKRTYKFIGTPFMAKKPLKDRVTVLVGASMDGFKLKPVVIGKAQLPRALRGVDMGKLPVHYYGQPSSWMSQQIMTHWFYFFLEPELREHYGENTDVIITLDNAGCHPTDLDHLLEHVEVKYLPPNTTAVIQPMDQGVIHVFKKNYMNIYYNKMIDYVLQNGEMDDPMGDYTSTYTMKDVLLDIGDAWEKVEVTHIHKCFEKLINPEDYEKKYNERHNTSEEWHGLNFRGFTATNNDNSAAERVNKIQELVSELHSRMDVLPENQRVTIDCDSVTAAIDYDPNEFPEDPIELIQDGFHSQREAEGLESEENDLVSKDSHKRETLKALANIHVKLRPEHFNSREEADKASTYLKGLQEIFLGMNNPTASNKHTNPRPSPRATSPEPSISGVSTIIRPSRASPVPADNISLEDVGIVHVTLDEDPEVPASPSPSASPSTASQSAASPSTASQSAASQSAASQSAADKDDTSNASDADPDVPQWFHDDAEVITTAASATAKASATRYLAGSSSCEEDMEVAKITALGEPGPGGRSSTAVATSTPSPQQTTFRPKRKGVRRSTCMYTDLSLSSEDISTSGDDYEFIPKKK